jgi:PBP1b-binding outer membrane lipoprotein LpoB
MKKFFLVATIALFMSSCNGVAESTQDTVADSTTQETAVVDSLVVDTVAVDTVVTEVVAE